VLFIVFAAAAILWAIAALRWSVSPHASARAPRIAAAVAGIAALASIAWDARSLARAHAAERSDVAIQITRRNDWWLIEYTRGAATLTAANELHLPAGSAVTIRCTGARLPSMAGGDVVGNGDRGVLVTGAPRTTEARFFALHPYVRATLPVTVESGAAFDAWLRHQQQPASSSPADAALFMNAGCAYCHRIRGAADSPWQLAPDLTHFAARRTIAGVAPIDRAHLSAWIVDSTGLKPSSTMPRNAIAPEVLHRLVGYLESLR
jgi:cytochrome c oxidase subunit II